ncbi:MAG: ABC transporter permease [Candidatus Acidiferrales bacterium]
MESLLQDLRFGVRTLLKNPGFTAIAVLTLSLGIGGNATVFSWIRAVLVNPLPGVEHSSQWLAVETLAPNGVYRTSSYPDYRDFRDQNHVFSSMIGFELVGVDMSIRNQAPPERVWGLIVTENYFDALGVPAAMGRTFHSEPSQAVNSDPYIVLGYGLWQRLFGSDRNVAGRTVHINGHPFTVIGVAPRSFYGTIVGVDAQYFVPMMMQPVVLPGEDLEQRAPTFVHIMGRLRPDTTVAQAQAEMSAIAEHLQKEYPNPNTAEGVGVYVAPVWKAHYGVQDFLRSVLAFLMIVAVLVLLIACVNVANLLLARATVREKEMAVRAALGASSRRLIHQLMVESLLLAFAGGLGGIFLALWGVNLLGAFLPPAHLPIALGVSVDGSVLAFTLILSLVTGLVFGLAPAWQISRASLNDSLKSSARTAGSSAGGHQLRDVLVVSEMVLATVLLVAAGLLLRSLHQAEATGPGFNTDHMTLAAFDLRGSGYSDDRAIEFYDHLLAQLRANPAVESVSLERFVPLWFTGRGYSSAKIENYTPKPDEDMGIDFNVVGPDYFRVAQIPLVSGRDFAEQDREGAPKVVIVNQTMANRFWPAQEATGHRVHIWGDWRTVVGVVRDIKYHRMNEPPQSFIYLPQLQADGTDANILVRSQLPKAAVISAIRSAAQSLDSKVQPLETDSLEGLLKTSMFANRTAASLASVLGILGTLLAALGIYGVLSYSVSQRIREIGIRVALGAQRRHVLNLVVGHGLRLALLGAALGALAAAAVTHGMASLLFGVSATDPLTFVLVVLVVTVVASLAAYIPARRAMRVDPMVALRYE